MGNKPPTPESWVKDLFDEKRENLWGVDKEEKIPYPSFWPPPQNQPTNESLSTLVFGKVFQFPVISPSLLYNPINLTSFPKINFAKVDAPSSKMMQVLSKMKAFEQYWLDSIQKKDIYYIVKPVFDLMNSDKDEIQAYLVKNLCEQLNFFGLIDAEPNYRVWFQKKLPFIPDSFRLGCVLFLLLKIECHFENENAPFLEWKRESASKTANDKIPILGDFKKEIPILAANHGNFWLGMNGKLKTVKQVADFWESHRDIIIEILHFKKAMTIGSISFPSGDLYTDNYSVRMGFFKIFKFRKDGQLFFEFPYWTEFVENQKFLDVNIVNSYIRNYFYLMVNDIQLIIPDIWEKPFSVIEPRIPWTGLEPVDDRFLERNFLTFKDWWKQTAVYAFFENNKPLWPPGWQVKDDDYERQDDATEMILDFISTYPPPALKVPPFSFSEWKRLTSGWEEVFELQWNAYFKWAKENAYARDAPNYVNPGEQLKNPEGELLWYQDDQGKQQPLLNTYPDYGIMRSGDGGPSGRVLRFLVPWATAADWIWGDDFWDFISNTARKVFKLVIDALMALYDLAGAILPSIAIILAAAAGLYLIVSGKSPPERERKGQ